MIYFVFVESSTENRPRGRPNAFSERELSDAAVRDTLSRRHRQNRAYAQRARQLLSELGWWEDLSEGLPVQQCVLTELGRIRDDETFGEAAWWYGFSGRGLTAKQAAAKIKEMRTGKTPEEGRAQLYLRLMDTIKDFRVSYPDASLRYVEGQVDLALKTIRYLQ